MAILKELGIGTFIVLSLVGTIYIISEIAGYEMYKCNDTGEWITGRCYEIKNSTAYGENVNCKWNLLNPKNYKRCLSGWKLSKEKNITGEIIDLPDYIEYEGSLSDRELLNKSGITEIRFPKCQRISKTECIINIKEIDEVYIINIINKTDAEIDLESYQKYNQSVKNYINRLSERDLLNQEKAFYINQSYGTERIIVVG